MTNEQLAALLYQLACRLNIELINIEDRLTAHQKAAEILVPAKNIVYELTEQVEMLTGSTCPKV